MRLIENKRLGYEDVTLISEEFSTVESRDDIELSLDFCNIQLSVPILASPMKDVCNGAIAKIMAENGALGFIHRFNSIDKQIEEYKYASILGLNVGCAIGTNGDYLDRFTSLYDRGCRIFCIDVANGASIGVENAVHEIVKIHDDIHLIVGNVVSAKQYEILSQFPAVYGVRVGVAGGCFVKGTKVMTICGKKDIDKIKIGDMVLTHKGNYKSVIATFNRLETKRIIDINGIKCTPNHKFFVINKIYCDIVNEDNINTYAEWVSAEALSDEYMLIKIT